MSSEKKIVYVQRPAIGSANATYFDRVAQDILQQNFLKTGYQLEVLYPQLDPKTKKYSIPLHAIIMTNPDILFLEPDYFLCHSECNVESDLEMLERDGLIVVSEPQLLKLASYKAYYHLDIFSDLIAPNTKYLLIDEINNSSFDFVDHQVYIGKLPHTSGSQGIIPNIQKHNVFSKIPEIRKKAVRGKIQYCVIQPQFKEYMEFRIIFINGQRFETYASENLGRVDSAFIMSLDEFKHCKNNFIKNIIKGHTDLDVDSLLHMCSTGNYDMIERNELLKAICLLNNVYQSLSADAEDFAFEAYNRLSQYLDKNPYYCRIDVIYDVKSGRFYLNEIEPFSSGKWFGDMVRCVYTDSGHDMEHMVDKFNHYADSLISAVVPEK